MDASAPVRSSAGPSPPGGTIEESARESVLRSLLATFIALTALIAVIALFLRVWDRVIVSLGGCLVYVLILVTLRWTGVRRASYLTMAWYLVLAAGAMASAGGIHDVTIVLLPGGIVMGALLLHRAHVIPLIGITTAIAAGIGLLSVYVPSFRRSVASPALTDVLVITLLLLVTGVVTRLVVRTLQGELWLRRLAEDQVERSKSELEMRNESLQLINQLADRLHRTLDTRAIASQVVDVLTGYGAAPMAAVYLLEGSPAGSSGQSLRLTASLGFTEEERARGESLPLEGSLSGAALRQRRILVASLGSDDRVEAGVGGLLSRRGMTTAAAVPLVHGDHILGSMNVVFDRPRSFTPLELETLQAIGQAVSLALTNARLVDGLEHQAFHDSLTTLPNRASLHRRFATIRRAADNGQSIGVVLVDLDRFHEINGALGHNVGDELLLALGARLAQGQEGARSEVFRLGGDEFAVLLLGVEEKSEAEARARAIHTKITDPCSVGGITIELGASVGVAVYPDDGADSHELLRRADVALHRAKQIAAGVVAYEPELDRNTPERLALTAELAQAVRDGGLSLHYQPKVSLETGGIVGFEALVRWQHPRRGMLGPADFLPLAEATDVINPLTWWVVETALQQLQRWNQRLPELTMSINLSARNLLDRRCSLRLEESILRSGVEPSHVEFELTETAVMTDPESALAVLRQITATGAHLAIDDFGTGYSSLAYLKRFPLYGIKIDRSFIMDMNSGEPSMAIVRSTVELARSLGLHVVAEGIEDEGTAAILHNLGCEQAQGYFFAYPARAEDLDGLLMSGVPLWRPPVAGIPGAVLPSSSPRLGLS